MDFSKYYFLSHIVDNLHDVKDAMAQEIIENAETIFGNASDAKCAQTLIFVTLLAHQTPKPLFL